MKGETIICLSTRNWHALWGESQKIMSRMAKQNKILYIEPQRSVNLSIISEFIRKLPNFFKFQSTKLHENLFIIHSPPGLPIARRHLPKWLLKYTIPFVSAINNKIIKSKIKKAQKVLKVKSPILWIYTPYNLNLVGKFNEKLACYHNYDEFADFVTNYRIKDIILDYDNELTRRVDVVFTTSRPQWERRKQHNPNTYFVPNGVDFDLFNRALIPDLPIPDDIASIPHPIIGLAGMLGNHVDVKLLLKISEAYPEYSLVLIGPDLMPGSESKKKLFERTNVYILGFKPLEQLPDYVQTFDVALIPYILEGHVLSGYPQKLHEYLAAGRSIVATAMPELQPYSQWLRIAKDENDFIRLIEDAKDDYKQKTITERTKVAQQNTWEHRVIEMYRILNEHLKGTS
jgi:glycosyltransferase involved in cell wall biosynthesis